MFLGYAVFTCSSRPRNLYKNSKKSFLGDKFIVLKMFFYLDDFIYICHICRISLKQGCFVVSGGGGGGEKEVWLRRRNIETLA